MTGWLDPQTVTLSVCAPGEVSACRIGGVPTPGGGSPVLPLLRIPDNGDCGSTGFLVALC